MNACVLQRDDAVATRNPRYFQRIASLKLIAL